MSDVRADVPRLEVRKTIHAPREAVFRAWTTPDSVKRWFSTPGVPVRHVQIDARVGGVFIIESDYQGGIWRLTGVVRELDPPARLSVSWVADDIPAEVGSVVTVDLTERAGVTQVVLTQIRFPDLKKHRENTDGWRELLEQMARQFEAGTLV